MSYVCHVKPDTVDELVLIDVNRLRARRAMDITTAPTFSGSHMREYGAGDYNDRNNDIVVICARV